MQSVDGKDRLGEITNTSFIAAPVAIFAESGISTALVKPLVLISVVGALSLIQQDGYPVAFFALMGICVVGLYISCVILILLRLRNPDFVQGPGT